MSKGYSGLFTGTIGTTFNNYSRPEETYSDRNIELPENLRNMLKSMKQKGDYIEGNKNNFSEKEASIISKESGVEFAKITIGNKAFLIRGEKNGTTIPQALMDEIALNGGTLDFHTHPYNDDLIPSSSDKKIMSWLEAKSGQTTSKIITPNGLCMYYNKSGPVVGGTVQNLIDEDTKKLYKKLFGGKK